MFADIINTDKNIPMISPLLHHLPSTRVPVYQSPFAFLQWEIAPQTCAAKMQRKTSKPQEGFLKLPRSSKNVVYPEIAIFMWKYEEIMIRLDSWNWSTLLAGSFCQNAKTLPKLTEDFPELPTAWGQAGHCQLVTN